MIHESFPNPERPLYWQGEEDHYRSDFKPGDIVHVDHGGGLLARIVAWNNTWSHVTGGRLVFLDPLLAYPGTEVPDADRRTPWSHETAWESGLTVARPGDIGGHVLREDEHTWVPVHASWAA